MTSALINVLAVLHVLAALLLIVIVLIQNKKGDALGVLGGSSSTIFGSEGSTNFLTKVTRFLAAYFMVSCVALATLENRKANRSAVDNLPVAPAAPVAPVDSVPAAPPAQAPAPGAPQSN